MPLLRRLAEARLPQPVRTRRAQVVNVGDARARFDDGRDGRRGDARARAASIRGNGAAGVKVLGEGEPPKSLRVKVAPA